MASSDEVEHELQAGLRFLAAVVMGRIDAGVGVMQPLLQRPGEQVVLVRQFEEALGAGGRVRDAQFFDQVPFQHLPQAVVTGLETLNDRLGDGFLGQIGQGSRQVLDNSRIALPAA